MTFETREAPEIVSFVESENNTTVLCNGVGEAR
jgi:hypothetical protein